jgi:hypothetical protein
VSDTKFCKDCKWLRAPNPRPMCGHPSSVLKGARNVVTGKMDEDRPLACEDVRMFSFGGDRCGQEGQFWEAAHVGFA